MMNSSTAMPTPTIEELWRSLRTSTSQVHRRVDSTHPLELYAEFDPPERFGLILFSHREPPEPRSLRSLQISRGLRPDGRWWLRLSIEGQTLQPVFAGLCRDIIVFTRMNVTDDTAGAAILSRVERWRRLLRGELRGLSETELRGLIGELVFLETDLIPVLPAVDAVTAWNGPFGAPQDFTLPTGQRIEVKAVRSSATSCRINGLGQLDSDSDTLILAIVRLDQTGVDANGAVTATNVVRRLRDRLVSEPFALNELESRLAAAGWHEHPDHERFAVRLLGIERHTVDSGFPRLIRATVPRGVLDADYDIALPQALNPDEAEVGDRI
jgi:hypothetical protein